MDGHGEDLLGDTQGVLALTDQCLFVVLPLRSDRDELKRVRSGTKLSVCWSDLLTGAIGQVDSTNGILSKHKSGLNTDQLQHGASEEDRSTLVCPQALGTKWQNSMTPFIDAYNEPFNRSKDFQLVVGHMNKDAQGNPTAPPTVWSSEILKYGLNGFRTTRMVNQQN